MLKKFAQVRIRVWKNTVWKITVWKITGASVRKREMALTVRGLLELNPGEHLRRWLWSTLGTYFFYKLEWGDQACLCQWWTLATWSWIMCEDDKTIPPPLTSDTPQAIWAKHYRRRGWPRNNCGRFESWDTKQKCGGEAGSKETGGWGELKPIQKPFKDLSQELLPRGCYRIKPSGNPHLDYKWIQICLTFDNFPRRFMVIWVPGWNPH